MSEAPVSKLIRATQELQSALNRVLSRRSSYSFEGLRVVRIDPDWYLVQRTAGDSAEGYVSVVIDLQGVVFCTCEAGLMRHACDHVRAVGEMLPVAPLEPKTRGATYRNGGSRNGRAKLDEQAVAEIRWLVHNTRLGQREIGARYGVGLSLVNAIATGRRWHNVQPIPPAEFTVGCHSGRGSRAAQGAAAGASGSRVSISAASLVSSEVEADGCASDTDQR